MQSFNKLNIHELHYEMNLKKESRTKSFDVVLERCHNKIKLAAKKELSRTYFDVPEFILGLPVYKLNDCITHIYNNLKRSGFVVKYFFPKLIYISWDFSEINYENDKLQELNQDYKSIEQKPKLMLPRESDRLLLSNTSNKIIDTVNSSNEKTTNRKTITSTSTNNVSHVNSRGKFVLNLD